MWTLKHTTFHSSPTWLTSMQFSVRASNTERFPHVSLPFYRNMVTCITSPVVFLIYRDLSLCIAWARSPTGFILGAWQIFSVCPVFFSSHLGNISQQNQLAWLSECQDKGRQKRKSRVSSYINMCMEEPKIEGKVTYSFTPLPIYGNLGDIKIDFREWSSREYVTHHLYPRFTHTTCHRW